jgi:L-fuconolactonase
VKIDAHQHFWRYNAEYFPWMTAGMAVLHRDYTPADLAAAQARISFDGSVAVQVRMCLEETRRLLRLADENPIIKGVVGYVDLCAPEAGDQIDEFKDQPKCVAMRHVVHDEPDDEFMLRKDFLAGLRALEARDLAYDLLLFEKHLPVAIEVVKQFPNLRFVLDHISKPLIEAGEMEPWAANLKTLASFENVTCKLSGMVTEANWTTWTPEGLRPYLDVVLETFGPGRLMIGSDWPVCLVAGSYDRVMNVVIDFVASLSADEQAVILGGSCAKAYGLPL